MNVGVYINVDMGVYIASNKHICGLEKECVSTSKGLRKFVRICMYKRECKAENNCVCMDLC